MRHSSRMAPARRHNVQHLNADGQDGVRGAEHSPVQRCGALRAACDEKNGQVRAQAEVRACLLAQREPVEPGDLRVPVWPTKTCLVSIAPIRLARPGRGLASCTMIGTRRSFAAR